MAEKSHGDLRHPSTGGALSEAEARLFATDPVMAALIHAHGPCLINSRERAPFETLVTSIISQQLSAKAAATIKRRLLTVAPTLSAAELLAVVPENLREIGLSSAKVRYILELSRQAVDRRLDFDRLREQPDDEVLSALTALPGIGTWTAEMFLIFALRRPDVLSLGDTGLQRAVRLLYGDATQLQDVGKAWRPYASTASWYLWRHLDT